MPTSQRLLFQTGCWACFVLAALHFVGFLQTPDPRNETERTLLELMASHKMDLLGTERSMSDLLSGFNLSFSIFTAFVAASTSTVQVPMAPSSNARKFSHPSDSEVG